jgi:hypothetical protein
MDWIKVRLSKKVFSQLPVDVAEAIRDVVARYDYGQGSSIKSFTYEVKPAGFKLYLGEDNRNTVVYKGQVQTVDMAGSHNFGASDLNYSVGKSVPIPTGAVVLNVWYGGTRGYQLHVISVDSNLLLEGK